MGNFNAKGGCGRTVPNRCRRRARDRAQMCMRDAWEDRLIPAVTQSCRISNVKGYFIGSLDKALTTETYAYLQGEIQGERINRARITVDAITSGNKGCGPRENKSMSKSLTASYQIKCPVTARTFTSQLQQVEETELADEQLEETELEKELEETELEKELEETELERERLLPEEIEFGG